MTIDDKENKPQEFCEVLDNEFTDVPNLAHHTKTPSHQTAPMIPQLSDDNDSNSYHDADLGEYQHTESLDINIDDDIKSKIFSNMPPDINDEYPISQYQEYYGEDEESYMEPKLDFYSDITKMKKEEGGPSVLLPIRPDLYESYLAPLLMIFSQIPAFSDMILKHQYLTFSYKPNWWNREKCSDNMLLLQEIQRLVAFLKGDSIRSFASIFNLEKCVSRLVKEEFETVYEFYDFFIKEVQLSLSQINPKLAQSFDELFVMRLIQDQNNDGVMSNHNVFHVPISSEASGNDIYQVVYNVLTQAGDLTDPSKYVFMDKIPGVISIFFDSGFDEVEDGFQLTETFYPQMFSYEHRNIIADAENEINDIRKLQRELSQKTFQLRAFQGKSVHNFLSETKEHLKKRSEEIKPSDESADENSEHAKVTTAVDNISDISSQVRTAIKNLDHETKQMAQRLSYLQGMKQNLESLMLPEMKAEFDSWTLIGVILNAGAFFYKQKNGGQWVTVAIETETCKSYEVRNVVFEDVQNVVTDYTSCDFGDGMVLIYVKSCEFESKEFSPLNEVLQNFIEKDNTKLQEQLEFLNTFDNERKKEEESDSDDSE